MNYTRAVMSNVVRIAKAAAKANAAGARSYTAHQHADGTGESQVLDLVTGGMCNRFVRQCFEVALGIPEQTWLYRAGRAVWTLDTLRAAGKATSVAGVGDLEPGDIVGLRGGVFGHIAIYVGGGQIAENTSSNKRGTPRQGTRLTPYEDIARRVTEVYRLAEPGITIVRHSAKAGDVTLTTDARMIDGRAWAPVREMAQGLGFRVDASQLATEDRIILSQ